MNENERYEINSNGELITGVPQTLSSQEREKIIEEMFSINGWEYRLLNKLNNVHYKIELENKNLNIKKEYHLFHGSVRKEDPERSRQEKKIQLGVNINPRDYFDNALILGFYVYENKSLSDTIIVAWPVEANKNYEKNPSLRVNMETDILPAKNTGYYVDQDTVKNLVVFRPEFIYYYLENYKKQQYSNLHTSFVEYEHNVLTPCSLINEDERIKGGTNILFYGVPGCGKSYTILNNYCKDIDNIERVIFHPDYTYSDFVGQILPITDNDTGKIKYEFIAGPFTRILSEAYNNPKNKYCLIIEEINRGNAPAIFGDIFQLLDRDEDGNGIYEITNDNIANTIYLNSKIKNKIKIPSNLFIFATMNTSDQNVFTLDTAFQRRWCMRIIKNDVSSSKLANHKILDTNIEWITFVNTINKLILTKNIGITSSEDKRLGAYFVTEKDLYFFTTKDGITQEEANDRNRNFPEKVLKYLWDDAFKFERDDIFNNKYNSLEELIKAFENTSSDNRFKIFADDIFQLNKDKK